MHRQYSYISRMNKTKLYYTYYSFLSINVALDSIVPNIFLF